MFEPPEKPAPTAVGFVAVHVPIELPAGTTVTWLVPPIVNSPLPAWIALTTTPISPIEPVQRPREVCVTANVIVVGCGFTACFVERCGPSRSAIESRQPLLASATTATAVDEVSNSKPAGAISTNVTSPI